MSEKFTPGQWVYDYPKEDDKVDVRALFNFETKKSNELICTCKNTADAKLVAAAPSMFYLLGLISTLHYEETYSDRFREWICEFLDKIHMK